MVIFVHPEIATGNIKKNPAAKTPQKKVLSNDSIFGRVIPRSSEQTPWKEVSSHFAYFTKLVAIEKLVVFGKFLDHI